MSSFEDRCKKITMLHSDIDFSKLNKMRLSHEFLDEAVITFKNRLHISCILVSSTATERTLVFKKLRKHPPKAGTSIKDEPTLGSLFKFFKDWKILLENLLDNIEKVELNSLKKSDDKKKDIEKYLSQSKYVNTRNKFAHGKELLLDLHLFDCLPDSKESISTYGLAEEEFFNPQIETISYIQLVKTLNFFIDFSNEI